MVHKLGLETAFQIETIPGFTQCLIQLGLQRAFQTRKIGAIKLIEHAFPEELKGEDPIIRIWRFDVPKKWLGEEGAIRSARAVAWMLRFGERMVAKNTDGTFTFNIPRMREVVWHEVFERHNLRSIIESDQAPYRTLRDAMSAGAALLGRSDLFGFRDDQLPLGKIRPRVRWSASGAERERAALAEELVKRLKAKHPQAFDHHGAAIPERFRELNDLAETLKAPGYLVISRSFGSVRKLLTHAFPKIFGWGRSQLKPWELDYTAGKWDPPAGNARFNSAFCYLMARHGLGKLTLRGVRLDYDLTLESLETWERKIAQGEITSTLTQHVMSLGFSGGLAHGAKGSVNRALLRLFGEPEGTPLLKHLCITKHGRLLNPMLRQRGGALRIVVAVLSPNEALTLGAEEPELAPSPLDPDTLLSRPCPNPLWHSRLAILTNHDVQLWAEMRIDPGRDKRLQDNFFGNRSWNNTPMAEVSRGSREEQLLQTLCAAYDPQAEKRQIFSLLADALKDPNDLRLFLGLIRTKTLGSLNVCPPAAEALKTALLQVTCSPFDPIRILTNSAHPSSRLPGACSGVSTIALLGSIIQFMLEVERAGPRAPQATTPARGNRSSRGDKSL